MRFLIPPCCEARTIIYLKLSLLERPERLKSFETWYPFNCSSNAMQILRTGNKSMNAPSIKQFTTIILCWFQLEWILQQKRIARKINQFPKKLNVKKRIEEKKSIFNIKTSSWWSMATVWQHRKPTVFFCLFYDYDSRVSIKFTFRWDTSSVSLLLLFHVSASIYVLSNEAN